VNINTATRDDLEALPAIGPTIAQRIVDDRIANGPYKQVEDLARVRGISARTVDQLRDQITVGP
jgi:competence protein ComEA